ncbi:winged helix DNA-binding domain-containing protein [Bacteriovoracaceae bacterium]|nr:winged helix DNA-binding domain-containing protein [Bacteriovoracaceae bacterium]
MIEAITQTEARKLFIHGQALNKTTHSAYDVLLNLGYVQIDTISVVERSHHHVFWSRFPKYKKSDLEGLINSRKAFEYWAHAAAYLPMKDYRYSLFLKERFKNIDGSSWWPRDKKVMKHVLKRIQQEGPLLSRDFKQESSKKNGWWDWKPAKKALERLFMEGELEITRREGFQKVFDLSRRVIPKNISLKVPSKEEYCRYMIDRTLKHHTFASELEMSYLHKSDLKKIVNKEVKNLVEDKKLVELNISGLDNTYYIYIENLELKPKITSRLQILSPFDNMVIQRKKLLDIFNFDYQIECYVPAKKRKYGYFTLPVLVDQKFIARIDCKVNRKDKSLVVISYNWEKIEYKLKYLEKLKSKINSFSRFNGCNEVIYPS